MSWNIKTPGDYINGPLTVAGSATITGALTVDTTTLVVDVTNDRVGIGTATPLSKLQSVGTVSITDGASVGAANGLHLRFDTGINTGYISAFHSGVDNRDLIYDAKSHVWMLPIGTAMTLNSSGRLGIGITPSTWDNPYKCVQLNGGSLSVYPSTDLYLSQNAYNSGGWKRVAAGYASQYIQTNSQHRFLIADTSPTVDSAIAFTQAMTLDATANLHVGTTAYLNVGTNFVNSLNGFNIVPNNTANAANRNWNIATNGGAAGNLDFVISSANNTFPNFAYRMQLTSAGALNNTTGTYGTISDLRLKENISDARNYLADLLKLRVVKYSLKEESSAVATKLGFIAQEVELVFPNLVDQSDKEYDGAEGIRSVKTSILIPMLLKAMQELTARVQTLEAR
jgi:hypothetical protein